MRDPVLEADVGAAADLPEAGQAGHDGQPAALPGSEAGHFADVQRPRPHQRHLPQEHVEQLRRFVEARLAQQAAQAGDPRVPAVLEDRPPSSLATVCFSRSASGRIVRNLAMRKGRPR